MSRVLLGTVLLAGALFGFDSCGGGDGSGGAGSGERPGGSGGAAIAGSGGATTATGGTSASGGNPSGGTMGSGGFSGSGGVGGSGGVAVPGSGGNGSGGSTNSGGASASGGMTGTGGVRSGQAGGSAGAGQGGGARGGSVGTGSASGGTSGTLGASSLAVQFANAVISRWPDPNAIGGSTAWDYNHGIVLRGIEQVYRHTADPRYLAYIQKYADEYVNGSGVVTIPSAHSFDNIQPAVLLPFLFQQTAMAKYHTGADQIRARYDSIPVNADGGFWHKQTYPNQMWLDSIYMGEPFLARYGAVFGNCGTFCADTVVKQVSLITAHVRDAATGLLYHAWDDSPAPKAAWADPTTGRSRVVWGRAMGWYAMALVDMLPDLPADHPGRSDWLSYLTSLAAALKATQDPGTGLWFQVVDQGSKSDDWVETSGSGMFVYALKVAVARGYIDVSYLAVATKGWQGLQAKVTRDGNNVPTITGAVQGMGVQNDYAGYVNQLPTLSNSPHGLCAILLAASEMEAQ